jgi:hypothetical protein
VTSDSHFVVVKDNLLYATFAMLPWPLAFAFFARDLIDYSFEFVYFFVALPALLYFEFTGEKCAPHVGLLIWGALLLLPGILGYRIGMVAKPTLAILALYSCVNGILGVVVLSGKGV